MSRAPRAASPHDLLRQAPGGSFTARARGLLKLEFILLNPNGREFGRLQLRGASGAELWLGDRVVTFETSGRGHRMVVDGKEVLVAAPKGRPGGELQVSCGGQSYEARTDLLRNLAVASYREGGEKALRLSGGLLGRHYEALPHPRRQIRFPDRSVPPLVRRREPATRLPQGELGEESRDVEGFSRELAP